MGMQWVTLMGTLCLLVAAVNSAAVPTQDTIVVARSDDTIDTTTLVAETEPTTEGPQPPVKLTEMEVLSEVTMRYAQTAVVARMRNPGKRAREAHFRVLLPETAFISGFVMTIDGKSYKAYVKEKEEAKQIYQDAISHGIGAAHVEAKARDSNHFTVSVNIEALSSAVFNLTYEELLVRRNGVYNHAINLHPGALVPKLTVTVHIKETENISELRVPEIRTGNEIDATKDDAQNTQATIVKSEDGREATITFKPDLQEQERLIQVYTEKSKDSAAVASHSYSWAHSEPQNEVPGGVLGQFVVQYDVTRPKDGEVLVNDGYFVHFFAPSDLPPLSKHVVFVLDTSGSMMDRKIVQLREAMQTILSELNPGDYFSIVEFESSVTVHNLKEADGEPPKRHYSFYDYNDRTTSLVPPSPATPENIAKAKLIVSWLQASGGTNIGRALDVAVQLINKGVDWKLPEANATTPPTTAEKVASTDSPTTTPLATTITEVSVTTETPDKKETKTLEPIIIFLTDGDPTVGETNPKRIITAIAEKNYGPNKATIFSLAFGEDADRKFLRKVSLRNGGFMRHIYEAADAALQLRDFYRQISSPLLADVKFTYPKEQVKEGSLTKHDFRTYYAGSEVVVAGRVADAGAELSPHVAGFCGVRDGYGRIHYDSHPKPPVAQPRAGLLPLERLWAYLSIRQLLDQRDAAEGDDKPAEEDKDKTPEKKALALALKYSFVTPLTSLVVVKPNETNAVNAESVDKTASVRPQAFSGVPLSVNLAARPAAASFGISGLSGSSYFQSYAGQPQVAYDSPVDFLEEAEVEDYADGHSFSTRSGVAYVRPMITPLKYRPHAALSGTRIHSYPSSGGVSHHYPTSGVLKHGYPSSGGLEHYPYPVLTTPVVFVPLTTDTTPVAAPAPLSEYRLQNYTWVAALLDRSSDSLVLETNGTTHHLKLTKDLEVPKESSGDEKCASAVDGGEGVCVYLPRCDSARQITVDVYKTAYCTVTQGYAGVCCQQSKVDVTV